jgi:hypothetical protein
MRILLSTVFLRGWLALKRCLAMEAAENGRFYGETSE